TESQRVQKELEEAYAQVFHTGRLSQLGEMTMSIAREINLLLNSISRANHSMLIDTKEGRIPPLPLKVERNLNRIDIQIAKVKDIIEHMRIFSRKETDSSHRQLIDVADSVKGALLLTEEQFKIRDIKIEMDFQPDLPDVLANPSWLEQVFLNLMTNARDAMEDQPRTEKHVLSIRGRRGHDGGVVIDVSDTGGGIQQEIRDKIFEAFFTTKEPGTGTGLGLTISRGIIKEHGGDLSLVPHEGKGSTFRITLPPPE
ncbi:MAG: GHKL domain-containing protein, partial [Nitrospirae bacterium]